MRTRLWGIVTAVLATAAAGQVCYPASEEMPEEGRGRRDPRRWIKLSGRVTARADSFRGPGAAHNRLLERTRFDLTGSGRLCHFAVSLLDGRASQGGGILSSFNAARDSVDLAEGWVECGTTEGPGWRIRSGRQELRFGDERLIGGGAGWDNPGSAFDAATVELRSGTAGVQLFAGAPVEVRSGWNRRSRERSLSGAYGSVRAGKLRVDPYFLKTSDTGDASSRATIGVHVPGKLPAGFDHNLEFTLQRGHVAGQRAGGWAAHLELGRTVGEPGAGLRVSGEYNYASGDSDSSDARTDGFDSLYASPYNKYGTTDPFGARNLHNVEFSGEVDATKRLKMATGYRAYWLASRTGGIWPSEGEPFEPAFGAGRHLTDQILVSATYRHSARWRIAAAVGWLVRKEDGIAAGWFPPAATGFLAITRSF